MACLVGDGLKLKERDMGIGVRLLLAAGGAVLLVRDRAVERTDT